MTAALAVGCDLVELAEIAESVTAFGDRYLRRVYTERERADAEGVELIARLAARYAAKEAALKALAVTDGPTPPQSIETVLDNGVPRLVLHGVFAARAAHLGLDRFALSLSHTGCHAMAVVVATRTAGGGGRGE